jgi:hypothetical protein
MQKGYIAQLVEIAHKRIQFSQWEAREQRYPKSEQQAQNNRQDVLQVEDAKIEQRNDDEHNVW